MELKPLFTSSKLVSFTGFNRTFMELKLIDYNVVGYDAPVLIGPSWN